MNEVQLPSIEDMTKQSEGWEDVIGETKTYTATFDHQDEFISISVTYT